jgi:hypothetical protein
MKAGRATNRSLTTSERDNHFNDGVILTTNGRKDLLFILPNPDHSYR